MGALAQDLRYAARGLLRQPAFTAIAVLTLALGIGANTAIFSVVNAVLLQPLPFERPERLVGVWDTQPQLDHAPCSYPEYLDWKEQKEVFEDLGAFFSTGVALTGRGEPEMVDGIRISSNLLPMLGLRPAAGRGFSPAEESPGAERVAMLSHGLWQRRFGGRPEAIGGAITLDEEVYTVVGVLPIEFRIGGEHDVAVPLRLDAASAPRGLHFIDVVGRLRAGVTVARARERMAALSARLQKDGVTTHGIGLEGMQERIVQEIRPSLLLFLGAVGLVLLIACSNVANLLLARAASRQKEFAVRLAMGASRSRLIRQLLTESVVLALLGGLVGLLFAWWGGDLLAATAGPRIPRLDELRLDATVLLFSFGISVLTGLLFGVTPALQMTTSDLHATLKEGGRLAGSGSHRLRGALVIVEVAVSLVLLVGAGLLIRSFVSLMNVSKGFEPEQVLAARLWLRPTRYPGPAQQSEFLHQVLERLSSIPGVESAALTNWIPLGGGNASGDFKIEGRTFAPGETPLANLRSISSDYFSVMRIPLKKGRTFTDRDAADSMKVAIVSESFVRRFFPGEDPIGRRIDPNWSEPGWWTIVGVVGDLRHESLERTSFPDIYLHYPQRSDTRAIFVLRTAATPAAMTEALRRGVSAVDPDQPVAWIRAMSDVVAGSVSGRLLSIWITGSFAAVALFLAAVGIYGVLSYSVAQRTHEIGIRLALGARRGDVVGMVVRQGMTLAAIGMALGLVSALGATRLMSGLLFGVGAADPVTYCGVPVLLGAVAMLACYIPARRATKVDPMVALRCE